MRLSIRDKIILPFAFVLVLVGVIGTVVATTRLTNAAEASFEANLLHSSLIGNQLLEQLDATRTADLRAATDTIGVSEALSSKDIAGLKRLLTPVAGNLPAATSVVCVLDSHGTLILQIENSADGPHAVAVDPAGFKQQPDVLDTLAGGGDAAERRAFLSTGRGKAMVYWIGPVRMTDGRIVGAALIGESVAEIARNIQGSAFYDPAGNQLASLVPHPPVLTVVTMRQVTASNAVAVNETVAGHAFGALFSSWVMRGRQLGFMAVQANADPLLSLVKELQLILTLVFTAAALLTLVVGTATASWLTKPVQLLVESMRTVSAGNLHHRARVVSRDEIGYLARTFNEMTASLEEKTTTLEATTFASMEALARAIDARDPSTFGHSARVAAMSLEIADEMHMPAKEREWLRRAALLHDIGKIGVEDQVLRKPAPLTELEAGGMREHPRIGYDMLKDLPFLKPSLPGVLYHHERWDGAGYPSGIKGTAIPLLVRILAVADVFDALATDRPYRSGLSIEAAVAAIRNQAGLQFDPDVVSAFLARRSRLEAFLNKRADRLQPEAA